jgi:hypothetical protein
MESLRELKDEDIRGMHERALNEEEAAVYEQTRRMGGLADKAVLGELDDESLPTVTFDPVLALGEGRRTLSWIWYSVTEEERKSGEMDGCKSLTISRLQMMGKSSQIYALNGSKQEPVANGGKRRLFFFRRKCVGPSSTARGNLRGGSHNQRVGQWPVLFLPRD